MCTSRHIDYSINRCLQRTCRLNYSSSNFSSEIEKGTHPRARAVPVVPGFQILPTRPARYRTSVAPGYRQTTWAAGKRKPSDVGSKREKKLVSPAKWGWQGLGCPYLVWCHVQQCDPRSSSHLIALLDLFFHTVIVVIKTTNIQ